MFLFDFPDDYSTKLTQGGTNQKSDRPINSTASRRPAVAPAKAEEADGTARTTCKKEKISGGHLSKNHRHSSPLEAGKDEVKVEDRGSVEWEEYSSKHPQHHQNRHQLNGVITKRARRNSTGQIAIQFGGGMNSHTAALNLQSSGQTAVVGHHRGFSASAGLEPNNNNNNSSSNNNNNSTGRGKNLIYSQNTSDCLWLPQNPVASGGSIQMPPQAPLRQHKRPAPQPGQLQHQYQHSITANLNPVIAQANFHMSTNPLNSQSNSVRGSKDHGSVLKNHFDRN